MRKRGEGRGKFELPIPRWYDEDGSADAAAIRFAMLTRGLTLDRSSFEVI